MSIETLISRLDGVKETGHGKYVARCPAHDDKSPSLAITEGDEGKTLVHCFAGCETEDVLSAVGLEFSDLMPERLPQKYDSSGSPIPYRPLRNPFDARQVLECIAHEVMVVAVIADKYAHLVDADDDKRLTLAVSRINDALRTAPVLRTPPELKAIRRAA